MAHLALPAQTAYSHETTPTITTRSCWILHTRTRRVLRTCSTMTSSEQFSEPGIHCFSFRRNKVLIEFYPTVERIFSLEPHRTIAPSYLYPSWIERMPMLPWHFCPLIRSLSSIQLMIPGIRPIQTHSRQRSMQVHLEIILKAKPQGPHTSEIARWASWLVPNSINYVHRTQNQSVLPLPALLCLEKPWETWA